MVYGVTKKENLFFYFKVISEAPLDEQMRIFFFFENMNILKTNLCPMFPIGRNIESSKEN